MRSQTKQFTRILSLILSLAMMAAIAVLPASAATLSEAQTSYGFFKSVGATQALSLLNNAPKKSYIKKGNPNSATSLTNMLESLKIIEETNNYRAKEGKSALKVTDSAMAMAQANADVSTVTGDHSKQFYKDPYYYGHSLRGENLSYDPTLSSGVAGWYNEKNKTGEKGHYKNMVNGKFGEAGAAISSLSQKVYGEVFQDANTSEKKYTVSQYRTRLQNYMNKVGAGTSSNSQKSTQPAAKSTTDLGDYEIVYTIKPAEETSKSTTKSSSNKSSSSSNKSNNSSNKPDSKGIYTSSMTSVAHSTEGTKQDYKDYRGINGNYDVPKGQVAVYVQEMKNDSYDGFYADIVIVNGTGKKIHLESIPKLSVYSDDGLICDTPTSIGFEYPRDVSPNSHVTYLKVRFKNVNTKRNFTTGTLRVSSTVKYSYAS